MSAIQPDADPEESLIALEAILRELNLEDLRGRFLLPATCNAKD